MPSISPAISPFTLARAATSTPPARPPAAAWSSTALTPTTRCTGKIWSRACMRLESGGYIKKYIAVLDAEKLNQGFVVFCSVKLRRLNRDIAAEFTRIIQDIPEVTECYNISGSYDYLLKIHAPNMKYYQEFILNVLGTIDSLGSLESTFVMAEVKHQYGIHI